MAGAVRERHLDGVPRREAALQTDPMPAFGDLRPIRLALASEHGGATIDRDVIRGEARRASGQANRGLGEGAHVELELEATGTSDDPERLDVRTLRRAGRRGEEALTEQGEVSRIGGLNLFG